YGVFNATLDGTTANTAVPVKAENNWWGLRPYAPNSTTPLVNTGPAISPASNPPIPENPVNGVSTPDGGTNVTSNAVDFFPFRNGNQAEPGTGEVVTVDTPGQGNAASPTVTLAASAGTAPHGDTVKLTASPSDDFGIRRVVFYDGGAIIGQRTTVPYTLNYKVPSDVTCAPRTLMALAEDSSG